MKYTLEYTNEVNMGGHCAYPWFPKFGTCKIRIRPKYVNDAGILNHERKHVEQYTNNWFHSIRYELSKDYRYKCELEAYNEQIKAYGYRQLSQATWIVNALYAKYNLDESVATINDDVLGLIHANG